ncbi:DNA helicase-2/ATP-dependent DNA helicase PcrA [Streptosporangium becharense]|uniref:DNA 3'-5' helicase n=1 Tax=Streptosporangium becharense TaxID=1816182 RepID=A0A7W9MI92_9ACTN|nr:ATP-dependent DNA helicase UvrD2 [Streptosporangium becharense]MBB2913559.1 DNA helicase-2/ATP-dependent DNA helicase PcrA [Streptosporangium becharense]MBB5821249.1 DNA helicase-2/ATP-dependent DNA helicase PcrA [Streptosporangium becharense]
MEPDDVLAGLDPEQREVAEAVRGPVCVLAGAGTGKTRAITHRIAHAVRSGVVDAQGVLAVTFTTRAAGELRQRLRRLGAPGVQARTFHAAALRQLTYFWPRVIGGEPPRVIESKLPLLADACRALRKGTERSELRDLAAEIEWAKATQIGPEDYAEAARKVGRTPPLPVEDVFRLYEAYERLCRERHLVDFETILELTAAVMTEHREVAAQIRQQYRYFVVDEYQDVNPLQKLLLDTWLGGRDDLCVVGDPNQTIYSFTGATPHYLTGFPVEYPDASVIKLVRDYRSTPQVVSLANRVLDRARTPYKLALVAQRPDGPEPVFTEYDDETAEAEGVARAVRKLADAGVPTREIAVLFRVNAQSEAYEQAFSQAGVPYVLRGADRFFERPEVRHAVVLLRGAARSADPGDSLTSVVHDILSGLGLTPQPPGGGKAREKWESLRALAALADDLAAEGADLAGFVAELERRAGEQHAPPVEGVTLASLHAAKGLEWDAVFLVGLTEGMLPIIYAETPDQIEEERRLLYVGITRARAHLTLSWALARSPGGRRSRKPSRFLDGLTGRASSRGRTAPAPGGERRILAAPISCRVCGKTLAAAAEQKLGRCSTCPAEYDESLLESLRTWRAGVAKEARIPPYVVFTDVTLQAIAERAPASEQDLLAITGIGRVKLDRYGEAVLDLCRAAANRTEDA